MPSSAAFSYVDIHPHFAIVRDFDEVSALIGQLRQGMLRPDMEENGNLDDGGGPREEEGREDLVRSSATVTYLPDPLEEKCYEKLQRINGTLGSEATRTLHPVPSSLYGTSRATTSVFTATPEHQAVDSAISGAPRNMHSCSDGSPLDATLTRLGVRRNDGMASLPCRSPTDEPRLLIVWDVDDTLVGSGLAGIRQHRVFDKDKMLGLFGKLRSCARHLLLSQGSIDDLFDQSGGGLLSDFREYFMCGSASKEAAAVPDATRHGLQSSVAALLSRPKKSPKHKDSGGSGFFRCGGTRATTVKDGQKHTEHGGAVDEVGVFDEGTQLVRLELLRYSAGTARDAEAMHEALCKSPPANFSADARCGRWLVLRPSVWGISLLPLEAATPPTVHTAFIDGRTFHKLDVVWSLAMSGYWDSVLFIDNNLCEAGVVRSGTRLSTLLRDRSGLMIKNLYATEYMLLAISAKLRQMERRYGRDVTVPPKKAREGETKDTNAVTGAAVTGGDAQTSRQSCTPPAPRNGATSAETNVSQSTSGLTADDTPSPTTSSPAQSHARGVKPMSDTVACPAAASPAVGIATMTTHVDPGLVTSGVTALRPVADGDAATEADTNGVPDDGLSCGEQSETAAVTTITLAADDDGRPVDLVVAHFHMSSASYNKVLHGCRTTQVPSTTVTTLTRYVGQPVLPGSVSCTDEEYIELVTLFQRQFISLFQYIEEEVRVNGYVPTLRRSRWRPNSLLVHMPIITPPRVVPHIRRYFDGVCDAMQRQLVTPLLQHSKLPEDDAHNVRSTAYSLYLMLMYDILVIDPLLSQSVAATLLRIYVCQKSIPRSLGKTLQAQITHLRSGG